LASQYIQYKEEREGQSTEIKILICCGFEKDSKYKIFSSKPRLWYDLEILPNANPSTSLGASNASSAINLQASASNEFGFITCQK
jgi:hypothetical protein